MYKNGIAKTADDDGLMLKHGRLVVRFRFNKYSESASRRCAVVLVHIIIVNRLVK